MPRSITLQVLPEFQKQHYDNESVRKLQPNQAAIMRSDGKECRRRADHRVFDPDRLHQLGRLQVSHLDMLRAKGDHVGLPKH